MKGASRIVYKNKKYFKLLVWFSKYVFSFFKGDFSNKFGIISEERIIWDNSKNRSTS